MIASFRDFLLAINEDDCSFLRLLVVINKDECIFLQLLLAINRDNCRLFFEHLTLLRAYGAIRSKTNESDY